MNYAPLDCSPASADMLMSLKPCFCSSLAEPCPHCAAPYGFQNVMRLSSDTGRFSVSVQQTVSRSQLRNLFSSVFSCFLSLLFFSNTNKLMKSLKVHVKVVHTFHNIFFKTNLIKYIFNHNKNLSRPTYYFSISVIKYTDFKLNFI